MMVRKTIWMTAIISVAVVALSFSALAQSADEGAQQVIIEVPEQGIGYSEAGELLLVTLLTNVSETTSPPLNVTAVLLNDCILPTVLQTCRFAAFGVFENVTPDGIAAGNTVQWTFNFGVYPDLDLSRWSVIWYQTPAN